MYGLVLEGGGTRGAYQVGVYEALIEEGIEIGGISGTSIGALNGSLLVQGKFDELKKLWENLDYSMVLDASEEDLEIIENLKLDKESFSYVAKVFKDLLKDRGLDITPLKELIDEYVDEEKVRKSDMDFGIVTVNISDFKSEEIFIEDMPEGSLKNYLLASAYLPIFKSEKLDGSYFLDGAFYDNLPFSMLEDKGYEKLIMVRVHGRGIVKRIEKGEEDILIAPREDLGRGLEFNPERSRYNMKLGYYDTLMELNSLQGFKYYINMENSEEDCFEFFLNLSEDRLDALKQLFKIDFENNKRALFEKIIPKLSLYLELDDDAGYRDIYVGLLEVLATNMGLERFKVYEEEELLSLVRNWRLVEKEDEKEDGILDKIIKTMGNITSLNKEETLIKSADIILR